MSEEYYQLDFGKLFKAVFRQKWIVILCLLITIVLSVLSQSGKAPVYEARVSLWMRETKSDLGIVTQNMKQLFFLGQQVPFETTYGTQIEIMRSALILEDVVKMLGLPSKTKKILSDSVKQVRSSLLISKIKNTTIIEVKAMHPSSDMAVKTANTVCEVYINFNRKLFLEQEEKRLQSMEEQARLLRKEIGKTNDLITERIKGDMYMLLMEKIAESRLNISLDQTDSMKVLDKAEEAVPVPVNKLLTIFARGILGLFIGIVLALVIDTLIRKRKGA